MAREAMITFEQVAAENNIKMQGDNRRNHGQLVTSAGDVPLWQKPSHIQIQTRP